MAAPVAGVRAGADLGSIARSVAIGIAGAGVCPVAVDLGSIEEPVAVGVALARIGVGAANLDVVGEAVAVSVRVNAGWSGSG